MDEVGFRQDVDATDRAVAIFGLMVISLYLVLGPIVLATFYQSRFVFGIKARSAYLILLMGAAMLIQQAARIGPLYTTVVEDYAQAHLWYDLVSES
ncbi:unnamed protein product [Choristocarpus tenellus]